ncbi:hypothetical protein [uncultured Microbacterium sp.]|uniref:hypothetical protein n=1 Tax=uncultured Microbacterium sp. TaxID=191216 RepID=UPI0028D02F62|nr:hypothetical protein [uncultured Microbacterium sp.]
MNLDTVQAFVALAAFFLTFAVAILGGMRGMLARMEQRTDERFVQVERRFEQVDRRFEQVDRRFEEIDSRIAEVAATLMDVKIALARIEGPHLPFLIARG